MTEPISDDVLAELERRRDSRDGTAGFMLYQATVMSCADELITTARRHAELLMALADKEREWREQADKLPSSSGMATTLRQAADEVAAMTPNPQPPGLTRRE